MTNYNVCINYKLCVKLSLYLYLLVLPIVIESSELVTSIRDLSPVQIVFPNSMGNQLGASVSPLYDFDGDGLLDFAIGAPEFEGVHIGRLQDKGAVFLLYGKDIQSNHVIDLSQEQTSSTLITSTQQFPIGLAIAGIGDINDDGFSDLALGTENSRAGLIYFGQKEPPKRLHFDEILENGILLQNTGKSVSFGDDINGDGIKDAIFGTPSAEQIIQSGDTLHFGAFTILFGKHGLLNEYNALLSNQEVFSKRGTPDTNYAKSVSGGFDLNTDGYSDIIITAVNTNPEKTSEAYIVFGGKDVFEKVNTDYGLTLRNVSGQISPGKDINADGFPELIVGLQRNQTLIIKGRKNLKGIIDLSKNPQNWGTLIIGAEKVYSVGDLNGDGFSDLAAAMPNAKAGTNVMAGQVMFLFGRPELPEVIDIDKIQQGQLAPIDYVLVNGLNAFDTFGVSIAGIGDIQNDGFGEVVIGAPTQNLPGESIQKRPGSVYLIQGIELYYAMQTHRSMFSQRGLKN